MFLSCYPGVLLQSSACIRSIWDQERYANGGRLPVGSPRRTASVSSGTLPTIYPKVYVAFMTTTQWFKFLWNLCFEMTVTCLSGRGYWKVLLLSLTHFMADDDLLWYLHPAGSRIQLANLTHSSLQEQALIRHLYYMQFYKVLSRASICQSLEQLN